MAAITDAQKLRAARRLVEEVLAGWVGSLPFAGSRLEDVRRVLGELGGDYQPNDPLIATEWQPIETVPPPEDRRWVLVWGEDCEYSIYRFGPGLIDAEGPAPTHWMPLPDPPAALTEPPA